MMSAREPVTITTLDYRFFDSDNHHDEAEA
jgi:hypothetical protein